MCVLTVLADHFRVLQHHHAFAVQRLLGVHVLEIITSLLRPLIQPFNVHLLLATLTAMGMKYNVLAVSQVATWRAELLLTIDF